MFMFMPMLTLSLSIYNSLFLSELNIQWFSHFCHKNSKVKQYEMRALYIYNNDYGYTDKQYENNLGHKKYINKNQQLCVMWR